MKLSIRLQNHGKRNNPLWWIVVAPNRKNIFGRFIEHVGYWYPRQGITLKRQILLNLVRIKYWIANGAVPSPRVQFFLSYYGVMPKPWYYQSKQKTSFNNNNIYLSACPSPLNHGFRNTEPEQTKQQETKEEQLTEKQKRKVDMKAKKNKDYVDQFNRYRLFSKPKKELALQTLIQDKLELEIKENQFLKTIIQRTDLENYLKVRRLANRQQDQNLAEVRQRIEKVKAEVKLLQKNGANLHPLKQSMLAEKLQALVEIEVAKAREEEAKISNQKNIDDSLILRKARHQMMVKRLEKTAQEMAKYFQSTSNILHLLQYSTQS